MDEGERTERVLRARAGDAEAFAALAEAESPGLFRAAWAVLGDPHEAEDAVQEALVRAFDHIGQLLATARFGPWLHRIVVNQAKNRLRTQILRHAREWLAGDGAAIERLIGGLGGGVGSDPGALVETAWSERELVARVARLPHRQRQVLLAFAGGEAPRVIAGRLGLSAGAVRVALHRARAAMVGSLPGMPTGDRVSMNRPKRGRAFVDRAELGRRVRSLGLELRDGAEAVESGEEVALPAGQVVVEHLVHDDGMLLVLWRSVRPEGARRILLGGALRSDVAADGQALSLMPHPGAERRSLVLHFSQWSGPGPGSWRLDGQGVAVPLPAWDGGCALPPAHVEGGAIGLAGYGYGGLGGRLETAIHFDRDSGRGLTFGWLPVEFWPPAGGGAAVPLPDPLARPVEPGPVALRATRNTPYDGFPIAFRHSGEARVAQPIGWSWHPGDQRQNVRFAFLGPLGGGPDGLQIPRVTLWERIQPVLVSFGEAEAGRAFDIPLGVHGAVLELRVGQPQVRRTPWGSVRRLPWRHRLRSALPAPLEVACMERRMPLADARGPQWTALAGGHAALPDLDGWAHQTADAAPDGGAGVVLACVGLGRPTGPLHLPVPSRPGEPAPTGVAARLAREALDGAALPLAADALRALDGAEVHARRRSGEPTYVGTLDLLAAILEDRGAGAGGMLQAMGVAVGTLLWALLRKENRGSGPPPREVRLGSDTQRAMVLAGEEARAAGAAAVGADHLLLGLLREGQSAAAQGMEDAGIDLGRVRRAVGDPRGRGGAS